MHVHRVLTWPPSLEALGERLARPAKACELEREICRVLGRDGLVLSTDERLVVNHLSRLCRDHLVAVREAWANLRAAQLVRPIRKESNGTCWAVVLDLDGAGAPCVAA